MTDRDPAQEREDVLHARLRAAVEAAPTPETRARHLAAVRAARGVSAPAASTRRRWTTVAVTFAAALLPVGVAAAAESALPGDVLYPVKRSVEAVRAVVDERVVAVHRVDELAGLLDRGAAVGVVEPALDDAVAAVDQVEDVRLRHRVALLATEARRRHRGLDLPPSVVAADPDLLPPDLRRPPTPAPTRPAPGASDPDGERPRGDGPTPTPGRTSSPDRPPPPPEDRPPSPAVTDETRPEEPRQERHEAAGAGVVTISVDAGVHLVDVRAADGWAWRADRGDEPSRVTVAFRHRDGRRVVLTAVHRDGQVVVRVERSEPQDRDEPTDGAR